MATTGTTPADALATALGWIDNALAPPPRADRGCANCGKTQHDQYECDLCGKLRCGGCVEEAAFALGVCTECLTLAVIRMARQRDTLARTLRSMGMSAKVAEVYRG
jgi:hypothetical protein